MFQGLTLLNLEKESKPDALLGVGEADSGAESERKGLKIKREDRLGYRRLWGWEKVLISKIRRI